MIYMRLLSVIFLIIDQGGEGEELFHRLISCSSSIIPQQMGGDDIAARPPPSCFYGFMASPSWFPLHRDHHSRFHLLGHEESPGDGSCRSRRWRSLLRRLRREGKGGGHGSKAPQLTFHYDIVSYSKNFDDGSCCRRRCEDPIPRMKAISTVGRPLK